MSEQKKDRKFTIKMQKKLVVLFTFVLLAFAGLCVRLYWITRENGEQYKKQVLSQQRYDSTTIPYRRGDILDARGNVLATSEKVYNLIIDAKNMLYKEGKYLEPSIRALTQYFGLDGDEIRQYVTTHEESSYKVMLKQLTYDQISGFEAAMNEKNSQIMGVWFEEEYKRKYPNGTLASDVIGFTGSDNNGTYGLEEYYNNVLNGTTGREYGYLTEDSTLERTVKAAVDGYTLHSTIDANIQAVVEKYLKDFNDQYANSVRQGNGAENVGCIIQEVDTGNILAMASYPWFDLNDPKNPSAMNGNRMVEEFVNGNGYTEIRKTDTIITDTVSASMTDDQLYLNLNYLWKNYCIADTYEPGSTIKPFTVAAGLECGALKGNEWFTCNGVLTRGGHKIHCHGGYGHGPVDLQGSVAWSCNVAMMEIAERMGIQQFMKFQDTFNFGLKTNIDLTGEARTAGLLLTEEQMNGSGIATNSFGQNFNTTMIQVITGFSALINGGYYYEPHVVDKITNSSGAVVESIEPRVLKQVISESTSDKIRSYCEATVMPKGGNQRTGSTARPAGYAIGGKTGTAQTIPRGNGEYVVSFIGFAPVDDPEIAIYVVVDRANAARQDDAKYATRIVRNVLTEVLPYLNIYMTEELSEDEMAELASKQMEITNNYTQMPEEDALTQEGEGAVEEEDTAEEVNLPEWMSFPIDEATGYRKDPANGNLLDPITGELVQGNSDAIGTDSGTDLVGTLSSEPER